MCRLALLLLPLTLVTACGDKDGGDSGAAADSGSAGDDGGTDGTTGDDGTGDDGGTDSGSGDSGSGDDGGGSGPSCADDLSAGEGCLTYGGETASLLPDFAGAYDDGTNPAQLGVAMNDGLLPPEASIYVVYPLDAAPGDSFDCSTAPNQVAASWDALQMRADAALEASDGTSCTITVDQAGTEVGEVVSGSFTAEVVAFGSEDGLETITGGWHTTVSY